MFSLFDRAKDFIVFLFALAVWFLVPGCASFQKPPVEAQTRELMQDVVAPVVQKALEGEFPFQVTGTVFGVNPSYVLQVSGKWVVGFEGRARVGVEGVAGNVSGASQSRPDVSDKPNPDNVP